MKDNLKIFGSSIWVSILGAFAAWGVGFYYSGTYAGAYQALFLATVLSVLEISLSFDNAVVNAVILKKMTPLWQRRFITWGMFFAVFVVRLVFPLLLVGMVASIGPWQALVLAATSPDEYAKIMLSAHVGIAAFGGVFLMMVALKYFFDENKEVHWIHGIESPLVRLGKLGSTEIGITLICIYLFSKFQTPEAQNDFLVFGITGLITFIAVDVLGALLQEGEEAQGGNGRGGVAVTDRAALGMFLYLQVLDASFSFDGVVGAFAISNNLFIIMIGLGVGAMFVRSLTIYMVQKGTLSEYRFLEHGAFYAIGSLALIMLVGTRYHIPEAFTGLLGALLIGLALYSSVRYNHKKKAQG